MELRNDQKILISSGAVFAGLFVLAIVFAGNPAVFANLLILGFMVLFIPYFLYKIIEFNKIKKYEEEFPKFLRDLSESQRAGLSISQALKNASHSEYGHLTKEIQKMSNQISWNVSLEKVLDLFGKRIKASKTITRALLVIDQANKSGGNIEETMESLAENIESLKDVQKEKATLLNQQVVMMYAIFFIFLGITIALTEFLIPLLEDQSGTGDVLGFLSGGSSNPCAECLEGFGNPFGCGSCTILYATADAFDFGDRQETSTYYKSLFFMMIIVQGVFNGLIAGQIGSDSMLAGIKHSMIMAISGFFMFVTYIKI